jgi:DNA-binding transcriptional MerR regulator
MPTREETAQRIVELRDGGMSFPEIAKALNAEGCPTIGDASKWTKQSVHREYHQQKTEQAEKEKEEEYESMISHLKHENQNLKERLQVITAERDTLKSRLDEITAIQPEGQRIAGWTITKGKDGYYRGHRKIGGQGYSVYLGKELGDKAKARIHKKNKELGVDG